MLSKAESRGRAKRLLSPTIVLTANTRDVMSFTRGLIQGDCLIGLVTCRTRDRQLVISQGTLFVVQRADTCVCAGGRGVCCHLQG